MFRQGKKEKEKRVSFLCSTGRGEAARKHRGYRFQSGSRSGIDCEVGRQSGARSPGGISRSIAGRLRVFLSRATGYTGWQIGSLRIGSYASVPRQGAWLECGAAVLSRATETRRGQWEKGIEKLAFRPSRRQIKRYSANLEVSSLSLSLFLSLFVSVCLFDSLLFV